MGMYDNVEGLKCPRCNTPLDDAQTKDGPRCLDVLHPGSVFTERREDDEHPSHLIAYDRCPICHIMWDIHIPIIRTTGKCILSPDESTYTYKVATWAISWEKFSELKRQGLR